MKEKRPLIGVIGASQASTEGVQLAEQVGALLAQHGALLVCGGLGGIMAAASRGCAEAGGEVIGILPGADAETANSHVTIPIVTNVGHARNVIIAHTAQALIAIEGEYGTLSEMAIGLKLGKRVVQLSCRHNLEETFVAKTPQQAVELALQATAGGDG